MRIVGVGPGLESRRLTPFSSAKKGPAIGDRLKFYSPAQSEYRKVALENTDAANRLTEWFQSQNILVKDGDIGFQNVSNLFVGMIPATLDVVTWRDFIDNGRVDSTGNQAQGYAAHYCNIPTRVNPKIVACSFIASGLRLFDI